MSASCPPPPPPVNTSWWAVLSGAQYCHLVSDGKCVTDGADTYGDAEDCEVLALKDFELGVTEFRLRDGSADGVSVAGGWYGRATTGPHGATITAGQYLTWFSESPRADSGAPPRARKAGFMICATMQVRHPSDPP